MKHRLAAILTIGTLLLSACSSTGTPDSSAQISAPPTVPTQSDANFSTSTTTPEPVGGAAPDGAAPLSPLASQISPLDTALYDLSDHVDDSPAPISISVTRLNVDAAPVVDVGVEDNGDMELPDAEAVGWYRFNAKPGQEGSSVLAAHINYNGTNGVFRYLSRVKIGDRVAIGFEDGTSSEFEIVEVAQYAKQELPLDRIFDKAGPPVLTLITCGGDFNRSVRSYDDNFVAYAVPVNA